MTGKKVFVFGIDGAPPKFIFKWLDELPNIKKLIRNGLYAKIRTSIPPSTCVAWTSFASGRDPSEFGVYSYTYRKNFSYYDAKLISSINVKSEMLWDLLTKENKKSIVLNVPLTYPTKPFDGHMVSGFLTPSFNEQSVYPGSLRGEIKKLFGKDYIFDVSVGLASYKNIGKRELIEKVYKMTHMHISLLKYLIERKEWDLLFFVAIGSDRLEHVFWSYFDEEHRNYKGETEFKDVIKDYYKYLDKELGKIIEMLDGDTTIIISSDHGMDKMDGRINLNDWLVKEGYLVLKKMPKGPEKLNLKNVDWEKTMAFAVGAYFGRIYFNFEGREPQGVVKKENYEKLQDELIKKLGSIKDDEGNKIKTKFFKPQNIYKGRLINESPDLYIYFDNLIWGVNNDVGNSGLYSKRTTIGSDDAGHAPEGIFIMAGKNVKNRGDFGSINIVDVVPTILNQLNIAIPKDIGGKIIR